MTEYYIFIDETGSFSYLNKGRSFVAGWVCSKQSKSEIAGKLKADVTHFNNNLDSKKISAQVEYPEHLHFMPLHLKNKRNRKDSAINIHSKEAPVLCEKIFESFKSDALIVFRSSGKPAVIANEQACYLDILRNTLVQLIDEPLFTYDCKINIVLGHRRSEIHYGSDGYENLPEFEKYMEQRIADELREAFMKGKKPVIKVFIGNARKEPGLIMADFFCGAFRWSRNKYLQNYDKKKLKTYAFASGYRRIGKRLVQQLAYLKEIDPVSAAVQCTQVLAAGPDNDEIKILFNRILSKFDKSQAARFHESMQAYMEETLVKRADRYDYLDEMESLIQILQTVLPADPKNMKSTELRLKADMMLHEMRISSHRGQTNSMLLQSYMEFLDNYGDLAFNNQMEIMQQKINAALMGAQVGAFNTFRFDDVEKILKHVSDKYYKMFENEFVNDDVKDGNLARLEGTRGQMYAFLHDIEKDGDWYELAETSLKKDVKACLPGTFAWEQGMGYLTALYWKKEELDKSLDSLFIESAASDYEKNNIYNLAQMDIFGGLNKPFILLHRISICALAQKKGKTLTNPYAAKEAILNAGQVYKYPRMLSAKWLAIIFAMQNDFNPAMELLNAALKTDKGNDYTMEVVRLPLKICRHLCLHKLGKKSSFSCEEEVKQLKSIEPDAEETLKKTGIEKYYNNINEMDFYEVGTLLPYYFS